MGWHIRDPKDNDVYAPQEHPDYSDSSNLDSTDDDVREFKSVREQNKMEMIALKERKQAKQRKGSKAKEKTVLNKKGKSTEQGNTGKGQGREKADSGKGKGKGTDTEGAHTGQGNAREKVDKGKGKATEMEGDREEHNHEGADFGNHSEDEDMAADRANGCEKQVKTRKGGKSKEKVVEETGTTLPTEPSQRPEVENPTPAAEGPGGSQGGVFNKQPPRDKVLNTPLGIQPQKFSSTNQGTTTSRQNIEERRRAMQGKLRENPVWKI
ncbi:hypothetical protein ACET3Z_031577 [Daucus carota]